jgi:hypothetical protein
MDFVNILQTLAHPWQAGFSQQIVYFEISLDQI